MAVQAATEVAGTEVAWAEAWVEGECAVVVSVGKVAAAMVVAVWAVEVAAAVAATKRQHKAHRSGTTPQREQRLPPQARRQSESRAARADSRSCRVSRLQSCTGLSCTWVVAGRAAWLEA